MPLLRVFSKIDDKKKITIPRGIRKELNIKPGDRLELTLGGITILLRKTNRNISFASQQYSRAELLLRSKRVIPITFAKENKARKLIISKTAGRCIK